MIADQRHKDDQSPKPIDHRWDGRQQLDHGPDDRANSRGKEFTKKYGAGYPKRDAYDQSPQGDPERTDDHRENAERALAGEPAVPKEKGTKPYLPYERNPFFENKESNQRQDGNGRKSNNQNNFFYMSSPDHHATAGSLWAKRTPRKHRPVLPR